MGGTSGELTSSQKQHARYELIIKRSPKLEISVVESQTLPKGHLVTLNALGVESQQSVRMQRAQNTYALDTRQQLYQLDFCTYFGTYNPKIIPVSTEKLEETKLCDVVLPEGESFGNRHFMIKF